MKDIKIASLFDFERHLDKELKALKLKDGTTLHDAITEICVESFKIGLKAGQLPENKPINLGEIR